MFRMAAACQVSCTLCGFEFPSQTTEDARFQDQNYQMILAPSWMCLEPPDPTTGFEAHTSGV